MTAPPEWIAEFTATELGLGGNAPRHATTCTTCGHVWDTTQSPTCPGIHLFACEGCGVIRLLDQLDATMRCETCRAETAAGDQLCAGGGEAVSVYTPAGALDRIAEIESALAELIARVERTGGYASPEEQDVLQRARRVLAGGGGR